MANLKISELTVAGALAGTELVEVVQGGVNKQTTTQDIADLGGGAVDSVNGQTGVVVLDAGDIGADPTGTAAALLTTTITNGDTTHAPDGNSVFDALALKDDLINTVVAITDASSMAITAKKSTLTTSSATRTFTITYTGDEMNLKVILNAAGSTFTFPAGALCVSDGVASGNNTCTLAGTSGDVYVIVIYHWGSSVYTVVCKNTGQ